MAHDFQDDFPLPEPALVFAEPDYDDELTPAELAELQAAAAELDEMGLGDGQEEPHINGFGLPATFGYGLASLKRERVADLSSELEDAIELAGGLDEMDDMSVIHLAASQIQLSSQREATRQREDDEPLPRDDQGRIDRALQRIAAGTYTPGGAHRAQPALAFSNAAVLTGAATCGEPDDLGFCRNTVHDTECGSAVTPDVIEGLQEHGHLTPRGRGIDANGWPAQRGAAHPYPAATRATARDFVRRMGLSDGPAPSRAPVTLTNDAGDVIGLSNAS